MKRNSGFVLGMPSTTLRSSSIFEMAVPLACYLQLWVFRLEKIHYAPNDFLPGTTKKYCRYSGAHIFPPDGQANPFS